MARSGGIQKALRAAAKTVPRVLPDGCSGAATAFQETCEESEGTAPLYRVCALADGVRSHAVQQRLGPQGC